MNNSLLCLCMISCDVYSAVVIEFDSTQNIQVTLKMHLFVRVSYICTTMPGLTYSRGGSYRVRYYADILSMHDIILTNI